MEWTLIEEFKKRIVYICLLILLVLYAVLENSVSHGMALFVLVFVLVFLLALEYCRIELNIEISLVNRLMRQRQERNMHGIIYFILSMVIALAVFDFRVAVACVLMTVFGDLVSSMVNQGMMNPAFVRNKTLTGILAELVVTLIIGFIVLENIYVILAMAFAATAIHHFVSELEDKLFVPLFSGFMGQLLVFLI